MLEVLPRASTSQNLSGVLILLWKSKKELVERFQLKPSALTTELSTQDLENPLPKAHRCIASTIENYYFINDMLWNKL